MADFDSLLNDIQEYLQDKVPPYLKKLPRLHPDDLLYRTLHMLEDLEAEIRELEEVIHSQEEALDSLEGDIARLENEGNH
jgi:hypothetical protein